MRKLYAHEKQCVTNLDNHPLSDYASRMEADRPGAPRPSAEEMLAEMAAGGGLPGRRDLVKVRYSHDAMIDLIVAHPMISQNQLAAYFGYSPAWVSTVMASDMFRARLQARRAELVDPAILASIEERFQAIVTKSQEVLLSKLSAPSVPDNLVLRAMELGAKALGLGGNAPPVAPPVPQDHLNSLAQRLLDLQSKVRESAGGVVDVESRVVEASQ